MKTHEIEVAPGVGLRVRHSSAAAGADPAPAFVLVHGLSSNARLWDEVAGVLAGAGHEVFAVDLRSHGESDSPPDGYDTTTAANDVATVCAQLARGPAVLVGQSWGGNVVGRLAARHPAVAAAVGLVDGGWLDLTASFDTWSACEAALRPPDVDGLSAAALRRHLESAHPDWSPAAIEATAANLRELPDGTVQRRLSIDKHMRIVRSMWDEGPWSDLPAITVPVLLMPALPAHDRADSPRDKRALVARAATALSRARVREYVGGDHDLHAQQPQTVAADLLSLAAEVARSGEQGVLR
ncbi:MAG TPA: alpha/beta hydrolase [Micromonosporaceae bacterium]